MVEAGTVAVARGRRAASASPHRLGKVAKPVTARKACGCWRGPQGSEKHFFLSHSAVISNLTYHSGESDSPLHIHFYVGDHSQALVSLAFPQPRSPWIQVRSIHARRGLLHLPGSPAPCHLPPRGRAGTLQQGPVVQLDHRLPEGLGGSRTSACPPCFPLPQLPAL